MKTMQVRVEGRVQGVYFRDYTRRQALQEGVDGWVRNCPDGSVEAVISGPENAVDAMLDWLQVGSPHARVLAVHVKEITPPQTFPNFQIRY